MFGSALYYPNIDIKDQAWLRSAILFWDNIKTIVPTSIRNPYRQPDTRICEQEGYLQALPCDLHSRLLESIGDRFIEILGRPQWLNEITSHNSEQKFAVDTLNDTT